MSKDSIFTPTVGNCIYCKSSINYNQGQPFCDNCAPSFQGSEYLHEPQNYCHRCGKKVSGNEVSKIKPECDTCKTISISDSLRVYSKFLIN